MKTIQEANVIRIMREEWNLKIKKLLETSPTIKLHHDIDTDNQKENIISPELKVVHKKSKIRYTVDSVGVNDIILRTPEGERFLVDKSELENYELD